MKKIKYALVLLVFQSVVFAQISNFRVSNTSAWSPEEVALAINHSNPNILAAGSNLDYFYSSTDFGVTWSQKNMSSSSGVWGDPCLIFDGENRLYFAHLSNPIDGYWIDRIVVQRSTDYGVTWSDGTNTGITTPKNQDKEWMAVDLTDSEYNGNLYISWTEFDSYGSSSPSDSSRILFSRSTDNGITWMRPRDISDVDGNCIDSDETTEGAVPAVGPEGQVYVAWAGPAGIVFDKSYNGGSSWGEDIFISDQPGGWDFNVSGIQRCNGMPVTVCDISDSPYRGTIYVMWGDLRNGDSNPDVFLSKSTDEGETWSDPIRVNDDQTNRPQFFPWMAIDDVTGNLYISFYDRRNTTDTSTDYFVAASTDGGESFTNIKVNEETFATNSSVFFGDYTNIAAFDGKIYPLWTKMVNSNLSVWTAPLEDSIFVTSVNENEIILNEFYLSQNYPNPFNPTTTISYSLPEESKVTIRIFDQLGQEVMTLVDKRQSKGSYDISFDASELSSGVYIYRIQSGSFIDSKKMILMK